MGVAKISTTSLIAKAALGAGATAKDQFLGSWTVTEAIFSAEGQRIGTVQQQRTLHAQTETGLILVDQDCAPCAQLNGHALAHFSGAFHFALKKQGRQRHYLGPDVYGLGLGFGDGFLSGQGVWPRFGYNFRSWSISLGEHAQLTGGCFYRGMSLAAVIVGVGASNDSPTAPGVLPEAFSLKSHSGRASLLNVATDGEEQRTVSREVLDAHRWVEYAPGQEEIFSLEPRGSDFLLLKNHSCVGMAKTYGPLLHWETHGPGGQGCSGIEVASPCGQQWFSIRQHVQSGRLASLEGLRFTLK